MRRNIRAALACALLVPTITGCGSTIIDSVPDEPVTLAIVDIPIDAVAKNDTHVFWRDFQGLAGVSVAGGPIERSPIDPGNFAVPNFAVDDTHVYYARWYSGDGGVMKRPLQGGAEVMLTELGWEVNNNVGRLMAVDEAAVYFADDNGVRSVPLAGGTVTTLTAGWPGGFTMDAMFLYWTDPGEGTVKRRPLDGSEKETVLATGQTDPTEMAVGGSWVCWLSEGQVHRASKDGSGTETTFGMGMPRRLAADSQNAYWIDGESGELRRMPLAGGEIVTLAAGVRDPLYLAVDDTSVYWLGPWTEHQAALKKLRK